MSNMVVRTNVFALNAHRNMKNVGLEQGRASNRLASGYRINSAADDAAGLAISETMRAQIRGLDQASRNAQDGQAMLLTTEGGLEEISNMLQRTRELMVQASNDTNNQNQRAMIEQEMAQLSREVLSMQNRVEFNTNRVLAMGPQMDPTLLLEAAKMANTSSNMAIAGDALQTLQRNTLAAINVLSEMNAGQVGIDGAALKAVETANMGIVAGASTSTAIGLDQFGDMATVVLTGFTVIDADAIMALGDGSTINETVTNTTTATVGEMLGQLQTRLGEITAAIGDLSTGAGGNTMRNAFDANSSSIREFVNDASSGNNIAFFQVGANASQGINFDFETVSRAVSGAGWMMNILASTMAAPGAGSGIGNGVRISPYIAALDSSIDDISSVRANLGAVQNRMDFTMRSLDISSENLQNSESRVRDADMAREMMRFTMANVLQQASISMLAQANQMPNNLLQLLR